MAMKRTSIHGEWSSRWAFILAATGSAVGLGNIWKFPYMAGEYGGGAFVVVYLVCVALIGIPVMMAEVLLGRRGRQSPMNTMRTLAAEEQRSRLWEFLGWMGMLAGVLILSFYSVIAGLTLAYVFRTGAGIFDGVAASEVSAVLTALTSDPERLLAWHTLFMAMTMVVVSRGVQSGLEQAVRFLMPGLFILLLVMVGYSMSSGDFAGAAAFLFSPDFSALGWGGVLAAMGQAFFSLSLGMGAIMMYGSYLPHGASIAKTSVIIASADTLVAVLAGLAIFPIVFANGLDPAAGFGLVFQTLPLAFGHMPAGSFFGAVFFLLLVIAAWTSAISLMEPAVAWLVENHRMNRVKATVWVSTTTWLVGIGTVMSFNLWSEATLFGQSFFGVIDFITSNVMLPLGGMLIAVFSVWMMAESSSRDELKMDSVMLYEIWRFLVRYITPVGIFIVFVTTLYKSVMGG